MDHFKLGRTRVRPTLHLSHAPANRVETGLDNRVRPTSEVGFDPVVSELEGSENGGTWTTCSDRKIALLLQVWSERSIQAQLVGAV